MLQFKIYDLGLLGIVLSKIASIVNTELNPGAKASGKDEPAPLILDISRVFCSGNFSKSLGTAHM